MSFNRCFWRRHDAASVLGFLYRCWPKSRRRRQRNNEHGRQYRIVHHQPRVSLSRGLHRINNPFFCRRRSVEPIGRVALVTGGPVKSDRGVKTLRAICLTANGKFTRSVMLPTSKRENFHVSLCSKTRSYCRSSEL